jgi:hypothetical protein
MHFAHLKLKGHLHKIVLGVLVFDIKKTYNFRNSFHIPLISVCLTFLVCLLTVATRTVGVISKIDQAAAEPKALAAVQALLLNQGPPKTSDIPWVALIGQSVSIASAQSGSGAPESSLETAWRAETESLKSILTGAPQSKLGRIALVESLAAQIRNRMKLRLPTLLTGYLFFA